MQSVFKRQWTPTTAVTTTTWAFEKQKKQNVEGQGQTSHVRDGFGGV